MFLPLNVMNKVAVAKYFTTNCKYQILKYYRWASCIFNKSPDMTDTRYEIDGYLIKKTQHWNPHTCTLPYFQGGIAAGVWTLVHGIIRMKTEVSQ